MQLTPQDFMYTSEHMSESVRKQLSFAYRVILRECKLAMNVPVKLGDNYLAQRAGRIYQYAERHSQLDALRELLFALHQIHIKENPSLIEPHAIFPVAKQLPVINENSPEFALCKALSSELHNAQEDFNIEPQTRWLLLALLLAKRCAITSKETLKKLLLTPFENVRLFPDAQFASVLVDEHTRVMLDAQSIYFFRQLHLIENHAKLVKKISNVFQGWWRKTRLKYALGSIEKLSFSKALDALSFIERPLSQAYQDLYSPLDDKSFVKSVSLQKLATDEEAKVETTTARKNKRASYINDYSMQKNALAQLNFQRWALDPAPHSDDMVFVSHLRRCIKLFRDSQPDQRRNTKNYNTLKSNVLEIVDEITHAHSRCSAVATLILTYCIDLLLHGSQSKSRLAMGTITTYLSTLISFAQETWSNEEILSFAQTDLEVLYEQTDDVAEAIGDLIGISRQGTVLRFLQYVHEVSQVKLCDSDELEYAGAGLPNARAHYINAHDFDATLAGFLSTSHSKEREQLVLYVELCYALGLRKNEALLIENQDVNFRAGVLYVTRQVRRKTTRAVRQVPLCFLSAEQLNYFEDHVLARKHNGKNTLFDSVVIEALLPSFLAQLRQQCGNDELVLHSLRHCAANNMLFQLCMSCYPDFLSRGASYAFLEHKRFSNEQLTLIRTSIQEQGKSADSYLPILDTLAAILGHVSPAVTAVSYLHLLDIIFFELNSMRNEVPLASQLNFFLSDNNYKFELKKKYHALESEPQSAQHLLLFKTLTRGMRHDLTHHRVHTQTSLRIKPSTKLSFSDFMYALHQYKSLPNSSSTKSRLQTFFDTHAAKLTIRFFDEFSTLNYATWMRLCERITSTSWNNVNQNALRSFKDSLRAKEIKNKRVLIHHLRTLNIFGLYGFTIRINTPLGKTLQAKKWEFLVESMGGTTVVQNSDDTPNVIAHSKPHRLRWAPWSYLTDLIPVIELYIKFIEEPCA